MKIILYLKHIQNNGRIFVEHFLKNNYMIATLQEKLDKLGKILKFKILQGWGVGGREGRKF